MIDKGIPRTGYAILNSEGKEIGIVTSGTQSPSTGHSIGLGLIERSEFEMGKELTVQVRKREVKAKSLEKPN